MSRKFKVGDVVRVIGSNLPSFGLVSPITDDDGWSENACPYTVNGTQYDADELELAAPLPAEDALTKFKAYLNETYDDINAIPGELLDIAAQVFGVDVEPYSGFKFTPIT